MRALSFVDHCGNVSKRAATAVSLFNSSKVLSGNVKVVGEKVKENAFPEALAEKSDRAIAE